MALKTNASFILTAGNFMAAKVGGVSSVTDPQWVSCWSNVYDPVLLKMAWYPSMGGWDWGKYNSYSNGYLPNPQALIQYTTYAGKKGNWQMPDHNYTVTYVVPGSGNKHLQIVVMDCGRITNNDPGVDLWIPKAMQPLVRSQHLAWLNATLASSSATWVIVVSTYESKWLRMFSAICMIRLTLRCVHVSVCRQFTQQLPAPCPPCSSMCCPS